MVSDHRSPSSKAAEYRLHIRLNSNTGVQLFSPLLIDDACILPNRALIVLKIVRLSSLWRHFFFSVSILSGDYFESRRTSLSSSA